MNTRGCVKLSELSPDTMVFQEEHTPMSVADLVHDMNFGEDFSRNGDFYIAVPSSWVPDVQWMLQSYLEDQEDGMYEGFYDRVWDVLGDCIPAIRDVFDKAIQESRERGKDITAYYEAGDKVEIDI